MLKELYRKTCDEYNRSPLAVTGGYYHEPNGFTFLQLKEVVKRLPAAGGVFLDIGTGCGIVPRAIYKLGARSITVDWPATGSGDAIVNARQAGVEGYYGQLGHDPLPVLDNSVDCVLFADVIEHLLHSPKPALADILRVLKRGGACVATTPNALRLTVRLKVPLGYSNWPLPWSSTTTTLPFMAGTTTNTPLMSLGKSSGGPGSLSKHSIFTRHVSGCQRRFELHTFAD